MKSAYIHILVFLPIFFGLPLAGTTYFGSEFLTFEQAQKKWGRSKFNAEQFKSLAEKEKGAMATDALHEGAFVGRDMLEVRKEMGSPDSYFFSDTLFAYAISASAAGKESWHLLFIPDQKLEKVKEVRIHKKCCYKPPF